MLIIFNCIVFSMIDMTNIINNTNFNYLYTTFLFISISVLPIISRNIVASYISLKLGYKPFIIYLLIIELYKYILPIIPNYDNYLYSLLMLLLPVLLGFKISRSLKKYKDKEIDYREKKNINIYILPTIIVCTLVYFTSGYFKYHAIAIGSGSMEPNIYKGDVVVIKKTQDYDKLQVNDIVAYKHGDKIIVHRLNKIIEENKHYYFYTKGDNNQDADNYIVYENEIIGIVNIKIPYIGIPTIWLNQV